MNSRRKLTVQHLFYIVLERHILQLIIKIYLLDNYILNNKYVLIN